MLHDHYLFESFLQLQRGVVFANLLFTFLSAVWAGLFFWLSLRVAIWVCGRVNGRRHLFTSIVLTTVLPLSVMAGLVVLSWISVYVGKSSEGVVAFLAAYPTSERVEQDLRDRLEAFVERAVPIKDEFCTAVGPSSPLYVYCRAANDYFSPWNPITRTFDYSRVYPQTLAASQESRQVMSLLMRRVLTAMVIYGGAELSVSEAPIAGVWQGIGYAIWLLIMSPLLLIMTVSIPVSILLELRWSIMKRLVWIVRDDTAKQRAS